MPPARSTEEGALRRPPGAASDTTNDTKVNADNNANAMNYTNNTTTTTTTHDNNNTNNNNYNDNNQFDKQYQYSDAPGRLRRAS